MKSSTLSTLALAVTTTILLTACGGDDKQASAKSPSESELGTFLSLHKQFCEGKHESRESLVAALKTDKRFKPAAGFNGVYETKISDVSYAVSPEVDGCTTDVLVQDATTGKLLFSYEQINAALVKSGYSIVGEETKRKDVGKDQSEVIILEKTFVSPMKEITNLDYPADKKDQYYMTLFAKKFEPVEVQEELSLNSQ